MHTYDFDVPVDRHGTESLKFDFAEQRHRSPDLLSLWVADMDFPTPDEVICALEDRARHGIFGYTDPGTSYYEAFAHWMESRYNLRVAPKEVVVTPGVVFALALCVRALTEPGDAVLVQRPVYYPFMGVVQENGRKLVNVPLVYREDDVKKDPRLNGYVIDFDVFERAIEQNNVKLFLLCNPHNPVGRVWTPGELERIGEICAAHDVTVVSDEIHMDFARPGFSHTSFASLSSEFADMTVTCTSASKTFNLAGLQVANIVVSNERIRKALKDKLSATGYSQVNTLGMVATQAAYELGADWLAQLKDYLEGNWQLLESHLSQQAPELRFIPAQSTYLAWIDCRSLGFDARQLERFVEDEAGLWLDCGSMFGPEGDGFIRINIATQRAYLEKALHQLANAIKKRG